MELAVHHTNGKRVAMRLEDPGDGWRLEQMWSASSMELRRVFGANSESESSGSSAKGAALSDGGTPESTPPDTPGGGFRRILLDAFS